MSFVDQTIGSDPQPLEELWSDQSRQEQHHLRHKHEKQQYSQHRQQDDTDILQYLRYLLFSDPRCNQQAHTVGRGHQTEGKRNDTDQGEVDGVYSGMDCDRIEDASHDNDRRNGIDEHTDD